MELSVSETEARVRDAARAYADEALVPHAARFDAEASIPEEVFRGLAERGLMAVNIAPELGGLGAGVVAYSLAMTEISRGCAATAVTMGVTNMVGEVIAHFGTEAQRAKYNPKLAGGMLGAFALSEVGAGSDPGGMLTRAVRDGDAWVLNGTKQWISHGDHAGVLVVWARTGGEGPRGISCFLVDGDAKGLSVAGLEDKMGLRASHTAALAFEDVRVPADALLGQENGGFRIAMMALDGGRIGIASQALGIAEAAEERAEAHVRAAGSSGQGQMWRIADGRVELDAARLLTMRAAAQKGQGVPFTREASMAKVFATEAAYAVCQRAVEALGEDGLDPKHGVERHFRDVRVTMIYEGTSEVQRVVIGRSILRG